MTEGEREWLKARRAWLKLNPPDHQGYYLCALCAHPVHISEVELDHIISRSKRPNLRLDLTNLQPAHTLCNRKKGSRLVSPEVSSSEYELRKLLKL